MGLTFKENCADMRNSGVEKVIKKLQEYKCDVDLYDPWAKKEEINKTYKIHPQMELRQNTYDGIVISVAHEEFKKIGINTILNLCNKNHVIYDLKYLFSKDQTNLRL